jgi:hypothetical protein
VLAHGRHRIRPWMLTLLVGIIGLAAHSGVLYYALSYTVLSAAVVSGAIIWMVIKHLGLLTVLFGPWYTAFRRRFWH